MGRKDKSYTRDIKQQMNDVLTRKLEAGVGTSKREAKKNGTSDDKIFSYNTYKTYFKHCRYFANYIYQKHPECTTLKNARKHAKEWLDYRAYEYVNKDGELLSASTIQTEAKAINKLFGIKPTDPDYFVPPIRRREEFKRSRVPAERDKHFSETNNYELIEFCKCTGTRREELENLKGDCLMPREKIGKRIEIFCKQGFLGEKEKERLIMCKEALEFFPNTKYFLFVKGKGGRERISPIIGNGEKNIVERIKNTERSKKVWEHVSGNADIHSYRACYATKIYKDNAREIKEIPCDKINNGTGRKYQSEVYICRKDEKGKKLDKRAMLLASKALGHNRIDVVANNYLRGL